MEIIKTYSLYLNSREATLGTSNNCTFIINPAITLTNNKNRFMICAEMIEVPYSFNQINSNNNILNYSYTDNSGSYNSIVTIPEGNYNITNLINTLIKLLLNDILVNRPTSTLTTNNFTIYYDANTSKVSFSIAYASPITIVLKFSLNFVLGICFGFPAINVTFGTSTTAISDGKVNVNPITSIYLRSDNIKFSTSYEAVIDKYTISDIVAKVPVMTLPNSILYFKGEQKQMINNTELSSLNLYWSDNLSSSYSLNLNGLNYGIYFTISEVMMKETNSFKDKLETVGIIPPKELYEERDKLLTDLLKEKEKLEKEVEEMKIKKNKQ